MASVTDRAAPAGLSATEVAERVRQGQVNRTDSGPGRTTGEIVRSNVFTLFNLIMGALFVVMLAIGDFNDALFGFVATPTPPSASCRSCGPSARSNAWRWSGDRGCTCGATVRRPRSSPKTSCSTT